MTGPTPPAASSGYNTAEFGRFDNTTLPRPESSSQPPPSQVLRPDFLELANSGSDGLKKNPVEVETHPLDQNPLGGKTAEEPKRPDDEEGCLSCLSCFLPDCVVSCLTWIGSALASCFRTLFCGCCTRGDEWILEEFQHIANLESAKFEKWPCRGYFVFRFASSVNNAGYGTEPVTRDLIPGATAGGNIRDVLIGAFREASPHLPQVTFAHLQFIFVRSLQDGQFFLRDTSYTLEGGRASLEDAPGGQKSEDEIREMLEKKYLNLPDDFFSKALKLDTSPSASK